MIAVLIWGSTFVLTQTAMRGFAPLTLVVLRFVLALVVLYPLARRKGFRLRQVFERENLLIGLTGVALFYALQNVGLMYTSAVNATLIVAALPATTVLIETLLYGVHLHPLQVAGIAMAVVGTAMVSTLNQSAEISGGWRGDLCIVGSMLAWSFYTVLLSRVSPERDTLAVTAGSFGAGILMVLPFALVETARVGLPHVDGASLGAMLYLSLCASGLATWLWNRGARVLEASVSASFTNLVPVIGVVIALFTGDRIGVPAAIGGVLALSGVWLSTSQAARGRVKQTEVAR